MTGASGETGLKGKIADRFDSIPVKGLMAAVVAVGGFAAATISGVFASGTCDTSPLKGVYHPARLLVAEKCAEATGTVVAYRLEHDGDYHVSMVMDEAGWTNEVNDSRQHGYTVVEFIPGLKHPKFKPGMRLKLTGTRIFDQQHKPKGQEHGWVEMHPVFDYDVEEVPADPPANPAQLAPPTERDR